MLTAGSLFSGIGSPELAFERCGITTLWASEIDPQAASVHARHFPRTYQLGDIRHVGKHNAAPVDIVVGGSPCQDFSQAGARAGLAGARSGLFHEYIRVIDELKPTFAIWENVPGVLTSHAGRDFAGILSAFHDIGARDICWRVLDAQYFGVPQRRRRVFLVADFGGCRSGEILFKQAGVRGHRPPRKSAGTDIAYALTGSNQRLDASNNETFVPDKAYPITQSFKSDSNSRDTFIGVKAYDTRNNKLSNGTTSTLQTQGRTVNQTPLITGTLRANGSGLQYASTNIPGDYLVPNIVGTIRASGSGVSRTGGGEVQMIVPESYRVRRLMPVECERLMGFPDRWTQWDASGKELADTPRYRMLGNSIAVSVMEWIARRMVEAMR